MSVDFLQSQPYAAFSCLGLVVKAKMDGRLPELIEMTRRQEGEFRLEDIQNAAMEETLLQDEERAKIAFVWTAAQERAQQLAKGSNPRSRQA